MDTPKFKVGDRVRCIEESTIFPYLEVGEVYEVLEIKNGCVVVNVCEERQLGFLPKRFELVEPQKDWEEKPMKEEKQKQELSVEEKARRYDEIKTLWATQRDKLDSIVSESPWPAGEFQVGDTVYFDSMYDNGTFHPGIDRDPGIKVTVRGKVIEVGKDFVTVGYVAVTSNKFYTPHEMPEEYAKQVNLRKVP